MVAAAVGSGGSGCAGPARLSTAIWSRHESDYLAALAGAAGNPRLAFYRWKAGETAEPIDEIVRRDQRLSDTSSPFDANYHRGAVSRGAVIYKVHCMQCHGTDVRGNGPDALPGHRPGDFRAPKMRWAVTIHRGAPATWFKKIHDGFGPYVEYPAGTSRAMPAFGQTLAREQIWLAIAYLQSLDLFVLPETSR